MEIRLEGVKVKIKKETHREWIMFSSTIEHSRNTLWDILDISYNVSSKKSNHIKTSLENTCVDTLLLLNWLGIPRTEIEFENLSSKEIDYILNFES